jgi:hypothetical protein
MRKKMNTFRNVSDPCIVPKAVEVQPLVDSIRSLIGESISIKIYEQNMAKANNTNASQRIAGLSLIVFFKFPVIIICFCCYIKRVQNYE